MPTNNSINTPKPIDVANGGTGQSTLTTANGILAAGTTATGAIQNIGTGSAGQVLTSNGTGLPSFQAAGGGDWVLLKTDTPSSAASVIYDNTYITTTYKTYVVVINDYDSDALSMKFSDDNGATYKSTGYLSGLWYIAYNSNGWNNINSSTNAFLTVGGSSNSSGHVFLYNLQSSQKPSYTGSFWVDNQWWMPSVGNNSTTNINNIKFESSGGTIFSGNFKLYGLK